MFVEFTSLSISAVREYITLEHTYFLKCKDKCLCLYNIKNESFSKRMAFNALANVKLMCQILKLTYTHAVCVLRKH